ncbi:MAG: hypothetical protein KJ893_01650 [Candidatus Omnitrophica bacterium]|nr:hypothetical protein [Candidatus Omnitrophota bacterium]MBU4479053.1 hypothetical protein [Candidatus Omnitrophota bacterium]MCG2702760.1 hypothetical protein [Candidatus Omnitrophota bacterium]
MMKKYIMKTVTTIAVSGGLLLCVFSEAQAQEKIKLQYDFKSGQKRSYQMKIEGNVAVEIVPENGMAVPKNSAKIEGLFSYIQEVVGVDPESKIATIKIIYQKSGMHTIVNNKMIPNADVAQLEGKVAEVTVARSGEVKNFRLPEGLPLSLQNADFRNMFTVFPERELRVGESWIRNSETVNEENENFTTNDTANTTYTLLGLEQKGKYRCAKVKVESKISTITKSRKQELMVDGNAQGRVDGVAYYDIDSGYVVYSEMKSSISNKIVTGQNAQGGQVTERMSTSVETDLKTITELL